MKNLITESQFDKIIFKYLDNQKFIQVNKVNSIYFVNSEGDEYAYIRYDKKDGWCYIYYKLVEEISAFFSLEQFDSEQVIGRWVENALQMEVANTPSAFVPRCRAVENALQMEVANTIRHGGTNIGSLRMPYKWR